MGDSMYDKMLRLNKELSVVFPSDRSKGWGWAVGLAKEAALNVAISCYKRALELIEQKLYEEAKLLLELARCYLTLSEQEESQAAMMFAININLTGMPKGA